MTRLNTNFESRMTERDRPYAEVVKGRLGFIPEFAAILTNSPVMLGAYLEFRKALAGGLLSGKFRENIALAVSTFNGSDTDLALHQVFGRNEGLTEAEIEASTRFASEDGKSGAGLAFVRHLLETNGKVSGEALNWIREAGFGDGEIVEIVANVAVNHLANLVNFVAQTPVDPQLAEKP